MKKKRKNAKKKQQQQYTAIYNIHIYKRKTTSDI